MTTLAHAVSHSVAHTLTQRVSHTNPPPSLPTPSSTHRASPTSYSVHSLQYHFEMFCIHCIGKVVLPKNNSHHQVGKVGSRMNEVSRFNPATDQYEKHVESLPGGWFDLCRNCKQANQMNLPCMCDECSHYARQSEIQSHRNLSGCGLKWKMSASTHLSPRFSSCWHLAAKPDTTMAG
jgi:hypothetical protein